LIDFCSSLASTGWLASEMDKKKRRTQLTSLTSRPPRVGFGATDCGIVADA
jgi:hypothetical protein